jgi:signal transduction histidine kinase
MARLRLNLLSNAFKFTPAGGCIGVRVRARGDRAVVEVEDTGPGIPPRMREAIFQRFRQLDAPAAYREPGDLAQSVATDAA